MEIRRELFTTLDAILPRRDDRASNTSSRTIIEMAAVTMRSDRFAGLHVFKSVPMMKRVEVLRTILTSDATIASLLSSLTSHLQWSI